MEQRREDLREPALKIVNRMWGGRPPLQAIDMVVLNPRAQCPCGSDH
ncbi:hypothetical protein ACFFX0_32865 [Citricoccus parietis]|uniref:Uncharacterized protein n=1 Tax=Citricoccus parietis TaxID=592307 RepID=A0ABV5G9R8_9MICC